MHWINAVAILVMIGSGWGIYNDSVIFHFLHFPTWAKLGSWAGKSLQWHFAFMWVLVLGGLAYFVAGLVNRHFRRDLLPHRDELTARHIWHDIKDHARLRLPTGEAATHYNILQKLSYIIVVFVLIPLMVLTGLAMWKPMQLSFLTALFGGFQTARLIHFLGMSVIVGFLVIHVLLSLIVPSTIGAMIAGGPRVDKENRA